MCDLKYIAVLLISFDIYAVSNDIMTDEEVKHILNTRAYDKSFPESFFNAIRDRQDLVLETFIEYDIDRLADDTTKNISLVLINSKNRGIIFDKNKVKMALETLVRKQYNLLTYGTTVSLLREYGDSDSQECILELLERYDELYKKNYESQIKNMKYYTEEDKRIKEEDTRDHIKKSMLPSLHRNCLETLVILGDEKTATRLEEILKRLIEKHGEEVILASQYQKDFWKESIETLKNKKSVDNSTTNAGSSSVSVIPVQSQSSSYVQTKIAISETRSSKNWLYLLIGLSSVSIIVISILLIWKYRKLKS